MIDLLLAQLRDKQASRPEFRRAADQVTLLLAARAARHFERKEIQVETPEGTALGYELSHEIVVVPILRAGLAMLPSTLSVFKSARVGFIGAKRDEETAEPDEYYRNLPHLSGSEQVVLIDPMVATGGSAEMAIDILLGAGAHEELICLVSIIGAPEGLERLSKRFPKAKVLCGQVDERLNERKFIVPGLGDFGDRYCGTD